MAILEQILNNGSLKTIEKMLLSETIKLKRKTKEILPYRRNYHTMINNRGRAYDDLLEAMEFYGIIK